MSKIYGIKKNKLFLIQAELKFIILVNSNDRFLCDWLNIIHFQRISEYSELEGSHTDHQVQLLSEWPIERLNPWPWCCQHQALKKQHWKQYLDKVFNVLFILRNQNKKLHMETAEESCFHWQNSCSGFSLSFYIEIAPFQAWQNFAVFLG